MRKVKIEKLINCKKDELDYVGLLQQIGLCASLKRPVFNFDLISIKPRSRCYELF